MNDIDVEKLAIRLRSTTSTGRYRIANSLHKRWAVIALTIMLIVCAWRLPVAQRLLVYQWPATTQYNVTLVVASTKADNTTWLEDYRADWNTKIYVNDDPAASWTVPANKGREAMTYLTYIIDHYYQLAPATIFQHANQYQWHNDDPLYDGRRMLDRLQIGYILSQGYVNLRCVWMLGCPVEIHPQAEQISEHESSDNMTGGYFAQAFAELFPEMPIPDAVGVSCCAQFAVTRDTIRQRSLEDYVQYRDWLLETLLMDHVSGRIFEYSWHMIFGKEPVYCPDAKSCYCNLYGLCNLTCETNGHCGSQYTLARYASMPPGWPEKGWDGEEQDVLGLRARQALDYAPIR